MHRSTRLCANLLSGEVRRTAGALGHAWRKLALRHRRASAATIMGLAMVAIMMVVQSKSTHVAGTKVKCTKPPTPP